MSDEVLIDEELPQTVSGENGEEAAQDEEPATEYAVMAVKATILTDEATGKKYWQIDPGVGLTPLFDAVEKGELTQEEYWEIDDAVRRLTEQIARISELSRRRAKRL